MRRNMLITNTQRPRGGFSLVELLVVIAIIAILSSLAFVALGASGNAAREASTKTIVRILSSALRERVDAFHDLTASMSQIDPDLPTKRNNRVFRTTVEKFDSDYNAAPSNTMVIGRPEAETFVRKVMFKSVFPQREDDLWGLDGISDFETSPYQHRDDAPMLVRMWDLTTPGSPVVIPNSWKARDMSARAAAPSDVADDELAESSELLYLSLTEGDVYGLPPAEIGGIDAHLIGDTDGDGNPEFLDGWGRPVQFYNWPSRLIKDDGVNYWGELPFPVLPATAATVEYPTTSLLISNTPAPPPKDPVTWIPQAGSIRSHRMYRDPEDVTKTLKRGGYSSPLLSDFHMTASDYLVKGFNAAWYHDVNTPTMPLVVSAGQDGVLGLHLPSEPGASPDRLARVIYSVDACQALGDNITNQQRGPQ